MSAFFFIMTSWKSSYDLHDLQKYNIVKRDSLNQVFQNSLWRHNLPRKLASTLCCIRGSRRENRGSKDGVQVLGLLPFWKTQLHFPFPPFPYFRASNLGKININFSGEVVTSSAVLYHPESWWWKLSLSLRYFFRVPEYRFSQHWTFSVFWYDTVHKLINQEDWNAKFLLFYITKGS